MILSIVIPAYNVVKYIGQCLDSILSQELDTINYEIIIINDGSTDGTLSIIEKYAKNDSAIKVISKPNGGAGSARNCGMDNATGKYIYFIDPDDLLSVKCLDYFIRVCEEQDLELLTFTSTRFNSQTSENNLPLQRISQEKIHLSDVVTGEDYLAKYYYRNEVWWYIVKREFLQAVGVRFDEKRYLEDATFTLELFLSAMRMAHYDYSVHKYRVTPGSIMTNKESGHYQKVITDMHQAAVAFNDLIDQITVKSNNRSHINRIKAKQEALVFFSMIRMLKSRMTLQEIQPLLQNMKAINAYPLQYFSGKDEQKQYLYKPLISLFNNENRFLTIFKFCNPVLRWLY